MTEPGRKAGTSTAGNRSIRAPLTQDAQTPEASRRRPHTWPPAKAVCEFTLREGRARSQISEQLPGSVELREQSVCSVSVIGEFLYVRVTLMTGAFIFLTP